MNNNYFSSMTDKELSEFYGLWNQSAKSGMMKQDAIVTKAIEEHCKASKIPVIDCERNMFLEISSRWNKEHTN